MSNTVNHLRTLAIDAANCAERGLRFRISDAIRQCDTPQEGALVALLILREADPRRLPLAHVIDSVMRTVEYVEFTPAEEAAFSDAEHELTQQIARGRRC